jgi:hypothetical protein
MRLTRHALIRARQRGIPIVVVEEVYEDPDYRAPSHRTLIENYEGGSMMIALLRSWLTLWTAR